MVYGIIFVPLIIILIIGCLIGYFLYKNACKKYVFLYSDAIRNIKEINKKYVFVPLKYNVVKKIYDDMINYNNVSPLDIFYCFVDKFYLAIKSDIKVHKENYEKYKKYIKEIKDLENRNIFINSVNRKFLSLKLITKIEKKYIREYIYKDIREKYTIKVEIILSGDNFIGSTHKIKFFSEKDIENAKLMSIKKYNGYYMYKEFWDAKVRVERAKVSHKMRMSILKRDNYRCKYCGSTENLEIDHIIPIAKGGKSEYNNLQTLCHRCNVIKGTDIIN